VEEDNVEERAFICDVFRGGLKTGGGRNKPFVSSGSLMIRTSAESSRYICEAGECDGFVLVEIQRDDSGSGEKETVIAA